MKPIFHISLGRSGTTLAMRLLASHPRVIANEAYPLEFRPAWSVLRPDDLVCREELVAPQYRFDGWEETIGHALGSKRCLNLEDVVAAYKRLSISYNKTADYFAEKVVWRDVAEIAANYPSARFSCTIRDPRDLLVSVRAFNAKRGFQAFLAHEDDDYQTIVNKYLFAYEALTSAIDKFDVVVVKYEDIFESPEISVAQLYAGLGLDSSQEIVKRSWARAHGMEDGRHRTSTVGVTGRWRKELPIDLKILYRDRLSHVLTRFGFPLD